MTNAQKGSYTQYALQHRDSLYAAGEMVGGIFYENYLGGAGLMSGAVFGRIAGASAGRRSKS